MQWGLGMVQIECWSICGEQHYMYSSSMEERAVKHEAMSAACFCFDLTLTLTLTFRAVIKDLRGNPHVINACVWLVYEPKRPS